MQHYFQDPGRFTDDWFSYFFLYSNMVKKFPSGSKFVEIGTWEGRSAVAMAVEIINSEKDIDFTVIDTFDGGGRYNANEIILNGKVFEAYKNNIIYDIYRKNIKPVEHVIRTICCDSVRASRVFADKSLDFVFIDGDHTYEGCKKDILAYLPKMKSGGVLAGHDFRHDCPGVVQAVDEVLGTGRFSPWYQYGDFCWYYEVP